MLIWKSIAQLGTVETTSFWSKTGAASQGPWMYLPCPSIAAISNHEHNFGQGLVASLAQDQPREEWGWASTCCSSQFVAAKLCPQYWDTAREWVCSRILGQRGCRKRAPAPGYWLCKLGSCLGPVRVAPRWQLLRWLVAPPIVL